MTRVWIGGAAAAIVLGTLFGAAPVPPKEVAPVADLEAEAHAQLKTLEGLLKESGPFADKDVGKKKIARAAGVIAVIGQTVAEHSDKAKAKLAGPDLRDAARRVITAATYDEAVAALPDIRSALDGKSTGKALPEYQWNKLMSLHRLMEEVEWKHALIEESHEAAEKGKAVSADHARHASALAALGLVMIVDTHEVKKPADVPEYQMIAKEFRKLASDLSTALHKGDAAAVKDTFPKLSQQCATCHERFRD